MTSWGNEKKEEKQMKNKQESLFEDKQKRTRNVDGFVKANSKDGSLSVRFAPDIAHRIRNYCWIRGLNCKKFANQQMRVRMDELEASQFDDMSREDLINLIKQMKEKDK